MSPEEYYAEAERLLELVQKKSSQADPRLALLVSIAQAHATLAGCRGPLHVQRVEQVQT